MGKNGKLLREKKSASVKYTFTKAELDTIREEAYQRGKERGFNECLEVNDMEQRYKETIASIDKYHAERDKEYNEKQFEMYLSAFELASYCFIKNLCDSFNWPKVKGRMNKTARLVSMAMETCLFDGVEDMKEIGNRMYEEFGVRIEFEDFMGGYKG